MNYGDIKNKELTWFSPYYRWDPYESGDTGNIYVSESITTSPKSYILQYRLSLVQHVDTKVEGNFLIINLYRKKGFLHNDSQDQEDVCQLFYSKKIIILPDMIAEKITCILRHDLVIIEIPRNIQNSIRKINPRIINLFNEPYYG